MSIARGRAFLLYGVGRADSTRSLWLGDLSTTSLSPDNGTDYISPLPPITETQEGR